MNNPFLVPYDSAEAKSWFESLTNSTYANPPPEPIPPCPETHTGCISTLVGSSLVYGHVHNDIDYLFYCPAGRWPAFYQQLFDNGWASEGEYFNSQFSSFRKEKFNLIVTKNYEWYQRFETAANLCKTLLVFDKAKRIYVHDTILNLGVTKGDDVEEVPF